MKVGNHQMMKASLLARCLLSAFCIICVVAILLAIQRREALSRPLRRAVMDGNPSQVASLLAQGANPNCWPPQRSLGLRVLDELDPDFRWHKSPHMTLLMLALESNAPHHDQIALDLVEHGAMVNVHSDDDMTPLMYALDENEMPFGNHFVPDSAVIKALLDRGADVNVCDDEGTSPLMSAAGSPNEKAVALLLHQNANVNAHDCHGITALMLAATMGQAASILDLLNKGAQMEVHDSNGDTALINAVTEGNPDTVKMLLDHGANPNNTGMDETSPLMFAASGCVQNRDADVRLLLAHNADVLLRDDDGNTALDYAQKTHDPQMIHLLIAATQEAKQQVTSKKL